jgi:FdhE protein
MAPQIGPVPSLEALTREHPEWRPWLSLLEETWREARDVAWSKMVPKMASRDGVTPRPTDVPLLANVIVRLDRRRARRWARQLFGAGASDDAGKAAAAEAGALFEAALRDDGERLDALARRLEVTTTLMRALAPLLVTPFLLACGRAWRAAVPATWAEPYCPVCGGWPTLAESRGLEQARRLRCGRDGSDWHGEVLRCVYCGTREHTALGALASEYTRDPRRAETCTVCRGYLKVVSTLTPVSVADLALADLGTVELDVAAAAHGYTRPAGTASTPRIEVVERRGRVLSSWLD